MKRQNKDGSGTALVPSTGGTTIVNTVWRERSSNDERKKRLRASSPPSLMNGYCRGEGAAASLRRQDYSPTPVITRAASYRAAQLATARDQVTSGSTLPNPSEPKSNKTNSKDKKAVQAKSSLGKNDNASKRCDWVGCKFEVTASSESLLDHVQRHTTHGTTCLWAGCPAFNKPARKNRWLRDHVIDRHCESRSFHCPVGGCAYTFKRDEELEFHVMYFHCDEENENPFHHRKIAAPSSSNALRVYGDEKNRYERQRKRAEQLIVQWTEFWKSIRRIQRFGDLMRESLQIPEEFSPVLAGLYVKKEWENFINGSYERQGLAEFLEGAMDLLLHGRLAEMARK